MVILNTVRIPEFIQEQNGFSERNMHTLRRKQVSQFMYSAYIILLSDTVHPPQWHYCRLPLCSGWDLKGADAESTALERK